MNACAPKTTGPVDWRLRVDGALAGFDNMHIDQALLEYQKRPDALPTMRFFQWARPTYSYGRLQDPLWVGAVARNTKKSLRLEAAGEQAGGVMTVELGNDRVEVVRRPTGGGVVRHDKDLSFSLSWRRDHPALPKCLKDVYKLIHATVRTALLQRNIETSFYVPMAKPGASGFCFTEPAEDDLMWEGQKILGGALRVTGWGRLYQGNLLVEPFGTDADSFVQNVSSVFESYFFKRPPLDGPALFS